MATHRMDRINEEMKKELAVIVRDEIKDPRLTALVSVTEAKVTKDLKYAKVYLSIYAKTPEEKKASFEALQKAKGFMRKRLSQTLNLRNTPELTLLLDTSIDYGMHMDELLRSVAQPAPSSGEETSPKEQPIEAMDDGGEQLL
ncbi:Ribosome-binding factor A [Clostridiaceae bacterium JG1575]|nr:Ribosome-binding factor A [Clostridiaceae bacterium JG1575]